MTKPLFPQPARALRRREWLAGSAAAWGASIAALPLSAQAQPAAAALTVQTTEGPYYLDDMPLRSDIREAAVGVPLELRLRLTDAARAPLAGGRVDVWQCDAAGLYSGFAGQGDERHTSTVGKTFLRGGQLSGADGAVVFTTVYPGWYGGRTTHIHVKVTHGGQTRLTTQFFLPDALNEALYTRVVAYRRAALRDTLNRSDGIALRAGNTVLGALHEESDRYVASLALVIDPLARPVTWRPGSGPPPESLRSPGGPPPGFGGRAPLPALQGAARDRALVPGAEAP